MNWALKKFSNSRTVSGSAGERICERLGNHPTEFYGKRIGGDPPLRIILFSGSPCSACYLHRLYSPDDPR